MSTTSAEIKPGKASLLYDPKIRGYAYQFLLLAVVAIIWTAKPIRLEAPPDPAAMGH